jgi:hypothetical protein
VTFEYRIAELGEAPYIVEETNSIVNEASSLARPHGRLRSWNPLTAARRSLTHLFAQLSRSTTRSSAKRD